MKLFIRKLYILLFIPLIDFRIQIRRNGGFDFGDLGFGQDPVEIAFRPGVGEAEDEDADENGHFCHCEPAPLAVGLLDELLISEYNCPGKKEQQLDFKQNKNQCDNVKPHVELDVRVAKRLFTGFVSGKFLFVGIMRAQEFRNGQHYAKQYQRGDDEEQDITEIGEHGNVPVLCKTRQNAPDIVKKGAIKCSAGWYGC